jgi:hypothetical protein
MERGHTLIFRTLHLRHPARDFLWERRGGITANHRGVVVSRLLSWSCSLQRGLHSVALDAAAWQRIERPAKRSIYAWRKLAGGVGFSL